jgi:DNA (cytosine-5)-methyltransferase 1
MQVIDLFAGAGGFSTGAALAGCEVLWAANHWPLAVKVHEANHPQTTHLCQDLHQADWGVVPAHDVCLASPSCQGHSRARGAERPHHDLARSTAWAVVSCLEHHRPAAALVENVLEFADWELYPSWLDALRRLGYAVSPHVVDAADHGVPQHRRRLFLVATRSRAPLHLRLDKRPHEPIAGHIDWERGRWSVVARPGRSAATLARVASGRNRFGARFLAPFYGSGSGTTGRSIGRPIGTLTTRDRWALIDGTRMRMLTKEESRAAMGFPDSYLLPKTHKESVHLLGNAVCPPVACDLLTALKACA